MAKALHDSFFKEQVSNKRSTLNVDIFRLVFTPSEFALFNWDTLKIETTTYITKEQREKRMDVVFSVQPKRAKQEVKIILLLEHKSYNDPRLLQQLLHYQTCIYDRNLHPVIPVLVYHGRRRQWKLPPSFQEGLKSLPQAIKKKFGANILNFKVRMLNLRDLSLAQKIEKSRLTSRATLYILSNIWELSLKKVEKLFTLGAKLSDRERKVEINGCIEYIMRHDSRFTWKVLTEIEERVIAQEEKRVMPVWKSTIQIEREKAAKKGREKGREEIALRLLEENVGIDLIRKCTGLTAEEIDKLKEQQKAA